MAITVHIYYTGRDGNARKIPKADQAYIRE